jgi:DNA ligase D-like protein (predicted 3'-phosphoesterase)
MFVIQQHDATRMHYDLRLEVGGVLVSWAVPRGPSMDPQQKRLAVKVGDHGMEHADVEGYFPKRNGAPGAVIVWDRGEYVNLTADKRGDVLPMPVGLERGHVKVWLKGEKLQGSWALTRTGDETTTDWLLVKVKDAAADPDFDPVAEHPESVITGRTIADIEANGG